MKHLFLLPCLLFLNALGAKAQPGCTDPQATNFDAAATENDGSCLYPATSYPPVEIAQLPADLEECSGLAFFNGQLWTHLDGGNPDQLHTIDTLTGAKLQTLTVTNADNSDWEDLAEDSEHLYIGDFGNNSGNRTDLRIYKIKKTELAAGTISPEVIEFGFSDQTDFTPQPNANNYDCEAFFFWQDSLHLFSKNWTDFKTRHYVLPASPGTHTAQLRDSLNVQGQITAADISADGTALLLGYNVNTSETFLWLLFDFLGSDFFGGNKRKISLGSALAISQPEGIVFRDSTRGFICSERFSVLPQKLLAFDVGAFLENTMSRAGEQFGNSEGLSIFPNPAGRVLHIQVSAPLKVPDTFARSDFSLEIYDVNGRAVLEKKLPKSLLDSGLRVDVSHLRSGYYGVVLNGGESVLVARFFKN